MELVSSRILNLFEGKDEIGTKRLIESLRWNSKLSLVIAAVLKNDSKLLNVLNQLEADKDFGKAAQYFAQFEKWELILVISHYSPTVMGLTIINIPVVERRVKYFRSYLEKLNNGDFYLANFLSKLAFKGNTELVEFFFEKDQ